MVNDAAMRMKKPINHVEVTADTIAIGATQAAFETSSAMWAAESLAERKSNDKLVSALRIGEKLLTIQ